MFRFILQRYRPYRIQTKFHIGIMFLFVVVLNLLLQFVGLEKMYSASTTKRRICLLLLLLLLMLSPTANFFHCC